MGWSVGFTTHEADAPDVTLVEVSTFSEGMNFLEGHFKAILDNMDEMDNDRDEYECLLADVQDISHDPGIMDDPDQWEDEDFVGGSITFYVFQD